MSSRLPKIILVFMGTDWPIYSRRPLLFALAEAARSSESTVVAVNRPLCPWTTVFRKPQRLAELVGKSGLRQLADNLFLYSPRYVIHDRLAARVPVLERLNLAALRKSYRHLQARLDIVEPNPIVWFNYPQQGYVTRLFDNGFHLFELYDNLVSFRGYENQLVTRLERAVRERTHLFVTTSDKLHHKYAGYYRQAYLLGNGLPCSTFERLGSANLSGLAEILTVPSPRLGYAGQISERLDWELILELASLRPSWNFVFVGRVAGKNTARRLRERNNIHHFGMYELAAMPSVWKSFDVGIMPYIDTAFFRYLNPLKFYEMAAAGLPSVSSPIEELRKFPQELVRVLPNDVDKWREGIDDALSVDRKAVWQTGRDIAGRFIWEDMAARLLTRIQELTERT
ncbi:MAG: glycosyltransferase [Candidatus Zixiibacteriota bacterium]